MRHMHCEVVGYLRRAITALAYFGIAIATATLAIDIVSIAREQPVEWDTRGFRIVITGVPWLIAVLCAAGCLSELRASPRSHASAWWLGAVLASYSSWLAAGPPKHGIVAGGLALIAICVVILDITNLSAKSRPRRARTAHGLSKPMCSDPSDDAGPPPNS